MAWRKKADTAVAIDPGVAAQTANDSLDALVYQTRTATGTNTAGMLAPGTRVDVGRFPQQTFGHSPLETGLLGEYLRLMEREQTSRNAPPPGPSDLPKPSAIAVAPDMEEYVEAAHAVDFRSPEVERLAFMRELRDVGCEVYDYDHVNRFLRAEASREANRVWIWKPVSAQAKPICSCANSGGWGSAGGHSTTTYTKAIPIEALRLMKIVADRVPDVRFYVSDYEVRVPDPFLLVMRSHDVQAVIYHWDEPGFKMKLAE